MPEWLQWVTAGGSLTAVAGVIATWIKVRPQWIMAKTQADGPLWARIAAVETAQAAERAQCASDIAELKAEVQVLRHDRNNVRQALTALFAMLKQRDDPELKKIVETVEEMIARGDEAIAVERAAVPMKGRRK